MKSEEANSLGFTVEADVPHWPKTIKTLMTAFPSVETIVPGHGKPGGKNLLTHTLMLLDQERARESRP